MTISDNSTDVQASTKLELGQLTEAGVYIGRFKSSYGVEKDWFTDTQDAHDENGNKLLLNFNDAAQYAQHSNSLGHNDWVVPTSSGDDMEGAPDILGAMFNNKAKFNNRTDGVHGFDVCWYWSASLSYSYNDCATIQRFGAGCRGNGQKSDKLSVRLVRSVAV